MKRIIVLAFILGVMLSLPLCAAEPNYDNVSMDDIIAYFQRQSDYETTFKYEIERRIEDYWMVEFTDFIFTLNDAYTYGEADVESISVMNVFLKWDVKNSTEQTIDMLDMYSDDMAVTLHERMPDVPIESLCIFWQVPSITKVGNAATYEYYSIGDKMYLLDKQGKLFE